MESPYDRREREKREAEREEKRRSRQIAFQIRDLRAFIAMGPPRQAARRLAELGAWQEKNPAPGLVDSFGLAALMAAAAKDAAIGNLTQWMANQAAWTAGLCEEIAEQDEARWAREAAMASRPLGEQLLDVVALWRAPSHRGLFGVLRGTWQGGDPYPAWKKARERGQEDTLAGFLFLGDPHGEAWKGEFQADRREQIARFLAGRVLPAEPGDWIAIE